MKTSIDTFIMQGHILIPNCTEIPLPHVLPPRLSCEAIALRFSLRGNGLQSQVMGSLLPRRDRCERALLYEGHIHAQKLRFHQISWAIHSTSQILTM